MEVCIVSNVAEPSGEMSLWVTGETPRKLLDFWLSTQNSQPVTTADDLAIFTVDGIELIPDLSLVEQYFALERDAEVPVKLFVRESPSKGFGAGHPSPLQALAAGRMQPKMFTTRCLSPYLKARIGSEWTVVLVDTGATRSVISKGMVENIGLNSVAKWYAPSEGRKAKGVSGVVSILGKLVVAIELGGAEVEVKFQIVDSLMESAYTPGVSVPIIGVTVLRDYQATLDFSKGGMTLGGVFFKFLSAEEIVAIETSDKEKLLDLCVCVKHPEVLKAILARIVSLPSGEKPPPIKKESQTFVNKIQNDPALLAVLESVGYVHQANTLALEREDIKKVKLCLSILA